MGSSIDLDIKRVANTPMKIVYKNKTELYGCFWYGDHFYPKSEFTQEMWDIYRKHHADTLLERLEREGRYDRDAADHVSGSEASHSSTDRVPVQPGR